VTAPGDQAFAQAADAAEHRTVNLRTPISAASRSLISAYSAFGAALDPNGTTELVIAATVRGIQASE
jgi:hypothetical protein